MAQGSLLKYITLASVLGVASYHLLDTDYAWIVDLFIFYGLIFFACRFFCPVFVENLVDCVQEVTQGPCKVVVTLSQLLGDILFIVLWSLFAILRCLSAPILAIILLPQRLLRQPKESLTWLFDAASSSISNNVFSTSVPLLTEGTSSTLSHPQPVLTEETSSTLSHPEPVLTEETSSTLSHPEPLLTEETSPTLSSPEPDSVPGGFPNDINAHEFQIMVEEKEVALKDMEARTQEIHTLRKQVTRFDDQITQLQGENATLQDQLRKQRATTQIKNPVVPPTPHGPLTQGEHFTQDRCWKKLRQVDEQNFKLEREVRKLTKCYEELKESVEHIKAKPAVHDDDDLDSNYSETLFSQPDPAKSSRLHMRLSERARRGHLAQVAELERERDQAMSALKEEKAESLLTKDEFLAAASKKSSEIKDLRKELADLKAEATKANAESVAVVTEKDSEISVLRRELADAKERIVVATTFPSSTAVDAGVQTDLNNEATVVSKVAISATREMAVQTDLPVGEPTVSQDATAAEEENALLKGMVAGLQDEADAATAAKEAAERDVRVVKTEHERDSARLHELLVKAAEEGASWRQALQEASTKVEQLEQRQLAREVELGRLQQQLVVGDGHWQELLRQFEAGKQQFEALQHQHKLVLEKAEPLQRQVVGLQAKLSSGNAEFEKLRGQYAELVARRAAAVKAVEIKDAEITKLKEQLAASMGQSPSPSPAPETPSAQRGSASPQSARLGESPFPSPRPKNENQVMSNLAKLLTEEQRKKLAVEEKLKKSEEDKAALEEAKTALEEENQKLEEELGGLQIDLAAALEYHNIDQTELDKEKDKVNSLEANVNSLATDVNVARDQTKLARFERDAIKAMAGQGDEPMEPPLSPRKRAIDDGPRVVAPVASKKALGNNGVVRPVVVMPPTPEPEPENDDSMVSEEE